MPPKIRFHCRICLLSILLVLPMWQSAHAWSAKGHRIVAELAERRLTPAAKAAVRELLEEEASPYLAVISTWADEVRDLPHYRKTARLHFINFNRNDPCHYVAERDCPDGQCIVAAIAHYRGILRDRRASIHARAEALKFVVHFLADIHQPLHSAFGDDRGANTFQVRYGFQGMSLHALFDRVLLESRPLRADEYADLLQSDLPRPGRVTGANPAIHWAESACRLVESEQIYPPRRRVEEAYVLSMRPQAEHQLQLAGARLAAVLNADLDTP
ncbi:MAG: S1/P1 nuclease [Lysobacteraceae bacterium]